MMRVTIAADDRTITQGDVPDEIGEIFIETLWALRDPDHSKPCAMWAPAARLANYASSMDGDGPVYDSVEDRRDG